MLFEVITSSKEKIKENKQLNSGKQGTELKNVAIFTVGINCLQIIVL